MFFVILLTCIFNPFVFLKFVRLLSLINIFKCSVIFALFYVYPNFQAIFLIFYFSDSLFINLSQHFCVLNLGSSIDSILCRPAQYSNSLSLYRARWSYPSAITFIEGSNTQIGYQDNVFKINDAPQERSNLSSFFKTIDVDSNLFFFIFTYFLSLIIFTTLHFSSMFVFVWFIPRRPKVTYLELFHQNLIIGKHIFTRPPFLFKILFYPDGPGEKTGSKQRTWQNLIKNTKFKTNYI